MNHKVTGILNNVVKRIGYMKTNEFCETLGYMTPEIANSEQYDYYVDNFSLGKTIQKLVLFSLAQRSE